MDRLAAALLTLGALIGCGPTSGAGEPDAGAEAPDAGPEDTPPDLSAGSWRVENVSQTPNSMGFYARQAFLGDGRRVVAWAEVDPENLGDIDVIAAERSGSTWSQVPLTDNDQQHTFTELVADGDTLYLFWSGPASAGTDGDIFLAVRSGGTWSSPIDLTSGYETGELRDDYRPRAALTPDGELVVAYLSEPVSASGIEPDVRVQPVSGMSAGLPITVIPSSEAICSEVVVAATPSGRAHLVAGCGSSLLYANDAGGSWSTARELEREGTGQGLSPDVAADSAGVHLVYRADVPCGGSRCGEIFYLPGSDDGVFERSVSVSSTPGLKDIFPTVTVDRWGRILVAYTEREEDDIAYLTHSANGVAFAQPVDISPGDVITQDEPADIALHPETGAPSVVFLREFTGSDPLNIDVFVADFLPQ